MSIPTERIKHYSHFIREESTLHPGHCAGFPAAAASRARARHVVSSRPAEAVAFTADVTAVATGAEAADAAAAAVAEEEDNFLLLLLLLLILILLASLTN